MTTNNSVDVTLAGQTGTGTFVGSNSPTLVTPALGTPSAIVLTNGTGLPVAGGGTGAGTFTAYAVITAGTTSTGAFQNVVGVGSAGNVLTSNGASALPTWQAAASGMMAWTDVTGTTQALAVNNGYIADNAGLVTMTLPVTAAQGTLISIAGNGAGGWAIAQNASQNIKIGNQTTTTGVGGSLASTNLYDQIDLLCTVANTTWVVRNIVGNITYV